MALRKFLRLAPSRVTPSRRKIYFLVLESSNVSSIVGLLSLKGTPDLMATPISGNAKSSSRRYMFHGVTLVRDKSLLEG